MCAVQACADLNANQANGAILNDWSIWVEKWAPRPRTSSSISGLSITPSDPTAFGSTAISAADPARAPSDEAFLDRPGLAV